MFVNPTVLEEIVVLMDVEVLVVLARLGKVATLQECVYHFVGMEFVIPPLKLLLVALKTVSAVEMVSVMEMKLAPTVL